MWNSLLLRPFDPPSNPPDGHYPQALLCSTPRSARPALLRQPSENRNSGQQSGTPVRRLHLTPLAQSRRGFESMAYLSNDSPSALCPSARAADRLLADGGEMADGGRGGQEAVTRVTSAAEELHPAFSAARAISSRPPTRHRRLKFLPHRQHKAGICVVEVQHTVRDNQESPSFSC